MSDLIRSSFIKLHKAEIIKELRADVSCSSHVPLSAYGIVPIEPRGKLDSRRQRQGNNHFYQSS